MDIEQFRKAGYDAVDRICDYYASLEERPVVPPIQPGDIVKALPSEPPEEGEDFAAIADDYQKLICQHPSFFAYFPTAATFEGMLGDLYASSVSTPGFNWLSSPASTELEMVVTDWFAKLLGLSPHFLNSSKTGGGVIQTSASDVALIITVAARARYMRLHPEVQMRDLVLYVTSQTHSLGLKAALVLGLQCRVLDVRAEDRFALTAETLTSALEEDATRGRRPFVLIATVGTTSSGAIDRLPEIGAVLEDHSDVWLHIDAAWAGVTLSCPEYREVAHLDAINKYATSFATNLHKWGLVNFDAALMWVKSQKDLTDALDVTPEFLRTKHADAGVNEYRHWHLGLGRRFRSLKLWFVLRSYGAAGFRAYIRRGIEMSEYFVSLIQSSPDFSLVTPPSFALTVFRLTPQSALPSAQSLTEAQLNELNRAFYARLAARTDITLTQTDLNGIYCVRFAVGAARTQRVHIDKAWALIQEEAGSALEEWKAKLRA
ncbi:pyridoxal phosphate-dependent transferase [Amylocystis lapponica]|nr:pyridoxal phosphate-dependent transferase [Amylocystis lapponica]